MHNRSGRRLTALVLTSVLCGAGPASAGTAPTASRPVVPSATEHALKGGPVAADLPEPALARFAAQRPLKAAADQLWAVVHEQDPSALAGIVLGEAQVEVHWKGAQPQWLIDAVTTARRTAPVVLRSARFAQDELRAAAHGVLTDIRNHPTGPAFGVAVPADGSGLVVDVKPGTPSHEPRLPAAELPLSYRQVERPHVSVGRFSDTAPFWGGGRILNSAGGPCSAGFGVRGLRPYAFYGQAILSAGHCGDVGTVFTNGDRTKTLGTASWKNATDDLLLVGRTAGTRIYDGLTTDTTSKEVAGWDVTFPGEYVCQSGASSGTVCNIRNTANVSYSYCDRGICHADLVLAVNAAGSWSPVIAGDSGGPVYTPAGAGQVVAKGIVSGSNLVDSLIYQDFATARRSLGVVPLTRPAVLSAHSSRCLDGDLNTAGSNGTKVQLWDCNGSSQQSWDWNTAGDHAITVRYDNRCLDADLNTIAANGTRVQLWDCNGSPQQRWSWATDGSLRNGYNGRCLDADLNTIGRNGTTVQLWDCNGSPQQRWRRM